MDVCVCRRHCPAAHAHIQTPCPGKWKIPALLARPPRSHVATGLQLRWHIARFGSNVMTATLILAARVLALDLQDNTYQPGYLLVEDDRLVELGPIEKQPQGHFDQRVDLGRRLVMPGLVNAHTHTPMTLFRGQAEGRSLFTLDGWFNTIRV